MHRARALELYFIEVATEARQRASWWRVHVCLLHVIKGRHSKEEIHKDSR